MQILVERALYVTLLTIVSIAHSQAKCVQHASLVTTLTIKGNVYHARRLIIVSLVLKPCLNALHVVIIIMWPSPSNVNHVQILTLIVWLASLNKNVQNVKLDIIQVLIIVWIVLLFSNAQNVVKLNHGVFYATINSILTSKENVSLAIHINNIAVHVYQKLNVSLVLKDIILIQFLEFAINVIIYCIVMSAKKTVKNALNV